MQSFEYTHFIPEDFDDDSRVWIYQSNRLFSIGEALQIEEVLKAFVEKWNSHGAKVKGYGNLLFGQFIVLMADENATGVSGCSTDSSVRLIKEIERAFQVSLFDRQLLAFVVEEKIQLLPLSQLSYALDNGFIKSDTLYFNNLAGTKRELMENWIIPLSASWLAPRYLKSGAANENN